MTNVATGTPAVQASKDVQLHDAVVGVVSRLQRGVTATGSENPRAIAALARLRGGLLSPPGALPEIWSDTVGALPPSLHGGESSAGAEPSVYETAAHAAVCLYAVHQQSRSEPMHLTGAGLGGSVRELRVRAGTSRELTDAVHRRFLALATATTLAETLHHLRSHVTQLRAARIPLDYGRLAVDLRRLQYRQTAPRVRLAWGRELYRVCPAEPGAAVTSPTTTLEGTI